MHSTLLQDLQLLILIQNRFVKRDNSLGVGGGWGGIFLSESTLQDWFEVLPGFHFLVNDGFTHQEKRFYLLALAFFARFY